jgi:hypothetical protein
MSVREVNELPPGDRRRPEANGPISSVNEAWFHTLDSCVVSFPLSEVILQVMRNCFVAGATYVVLLLQRGHADQLLRDIGGFSDEASSSVQRALTRDMASASAQARCLH